MTHVAKRLSWVLVLAAALPLWAQEPPKDKDAKQAEVPMTRVVLYSSGVGYFQHDGPMNNGGTVHLSFTTEQMNDILKSLVVSSSNSSVSSINYASRDPLTRALQGFALDISGQPTLADLLRQLRGHEVKIETPGSTITGRVLTIEQKQEVIMQGGGSVTVTRTYVTVSTGTGLKTVALENATSITLTDAKLQAELQKALELLATARDKERKPMEINFTGQGVSNVSIGYVAEMPIWKTSYRLDLGKERILLQGWAIVENPSDQDWKDVRLTLVSGRPISFIQDLYTPLYVPRPVVAPELYAYLRPQVYEEGMLRDKAAEQEKEALAKREGGKGMGAGKDAAAPRPQPSHGEGKAGGRDEGDGYGYMDLTRGVTALATAAEAGQLFRYTIENKVSLSRRQSAMLPILNTPIKAEAVSIYNQRVQAKHPLNGAYLENDTKLMLPAGPITVYEEGTYAGDARIENVPQGEKRLISYGMDLRVTVDPSQSSSNSLVGAKIVRGVVYVTWLNRWTQTYLIKNSADKKKTLIIEHPFTNGRDLVQPKEPMEKTPQLYRFKVAAEAGKTDKFEVIEQATSMQEVAILSSSPDQYIWLIRAKEIPQAVKDALAKAIEMQNQLAQLQSRLSQLQQQKQDVEADQRRLLELIKVVGRETDQGQGYLKKLAEDEKKLEQLEGQIKEARDQVEAQQKKLQDYLMELNVDTTATEKK